jgi:transposase-like protein
MHTSKSEIQMPVDGHRRGRYRGEFKRQIVTACREPGVSTAAIALANGLNANMVRRWVVESSQGSSRQLANVTRPMAPDHTNPAFIPVKLASPAPVPPTDIRIELQHARGAIQIHWPIGAASQCAQWLREVLA